MSLPIAILAGGLATRLRPTTETIPKALIEVAGRPFVEHQLSWLNDQGVHRVVFCVAYRGDMIRAAIGEGSRWNLSIDYVFDGEHLLGTGGALKRALPVLGPAFFVLYGDSYLNCNLAEVEQAFTGKKSAGLMTVFRNDDRWDRSNVLFQDGRIVRYDKRNRTPDMHHIDYGLGILTEQALARFPDDEPFDLAAVYEGLLAAGELEAFEARDRFYEIGSPQGLQETRAFLGKQSEEAR